VEVGLWQCIVQEMHIIEAGGRGVPRHAGENNADMLALAALDIAHAEITPQSL
jgi:hypothetical protein